MSLMQPRQTKCSQAGFTLIEILVALTIFIIASALMAPSFIAHLKYNLGAERRSGAVAAAQEYLDQLRALDPATLPSSGTAAPVLVNAGERTYSVVVKYCLTPAYCTSRSRLIRLEVSFANELMYTVETVFTQLQ